MYPGQMPQVRRNLVNVVLALDLSKRDNHAILSDNIATFISRGVGIRFGTVPLLQEGEEDKVQKAVARVMCYLVGTAGRASAMAFSREVGGLWLKSPADYRLSSLQLAQHTEENLDMTAVRKAYESTARHASNLRKSNPDNVPKLYSSLNVILAASLPEIDGKLSRAVAYNQRLGLADKAEESLGYFFVNGKLFPLDEVRYTCISAIVMRG